MTQSVRVSGQSIMQEALSKLNLSNLPSSPSPQARVDIHQINPPTFKELIEELDRKIKSLGLSRKDVTYHFEKRYSEQVLKNIWYARPLGSWQLWKEICDHYQLTTRLPDAKETIDELRKIVKSSNITPEQVSEFGNVKPYSFYKLIDDRDVDNINYEILRGFIVAVRVILGTLKTPYVPSLCEYHTTKATTVDTTALEIPEIALDECSTYPKDLLDEEALKDTLHKAGSKIGRPLHVLAQNAGVTLDGPLSWSAAARLSYAYRYFRSLQPVPAVHPEVPEMPTRELEVRSTIMTLIKTLGWTTSRVVEASGITATEYASLVSKQVGYETARKLLTVLSKKEKVVATVEKNNVSSSITPSPEMQQVLSGFRPITPRELEPIGPGTVNPSTFLDENLLEDRLRISNEIASRHALRIKELEKGMSDLDGLLEGTRKDLAEEKALTRSLTINLEQAEKDRDGYRGKLLKLAEYLNIRYPDEDIREGEDIVDVALRLLGGARVTNKFSNLI